MRAILRAERIQAWTGVLATLTAVVGVAALALPRLPAADTWWQLAAGRLLVETGRLPMVDPFSFASGRGPWLNHEWLAEVCFYLVVQVAGLQGLFLARTAVVVVAFAVLPLLGARFRAVPPAWAAAAILACALAAEGWAFFDVRPYLFTYLGLSATLLAVREYLRAGRVGWLVALVPLSVAWANCHGGYILGPLALAVAAAGCLLPPRRLGASLALLGAAGACTACALAANPYGLEMLRFPFSLVERSAFTVGLNEWAPPRFLEATGVRPFVRPGPQWPFLLLVVGACALLVRVRARIGWVEWAWVAAFTCAGLLTWRHIPLAALVLAHVLPDAMPREFGGGRKGFAALLLWTCLALLSTLGLHRRLDGGWQAWSMRDSHFPVGAVAFLEANPSLPARLFNPYEWGGYLAWAVYPTHRVFVDGRANTLYTQAHYARALWVEFGEPWRALLERKGLGGLVQDPAGWEGVLREADIELVLCTRLQGDLPERLEASGRWFCVYRDAVSAVFLLDSPEMRELAEGLRKPVTAWSLLEVALGEVRAGREPEAAAHLEEALGLDPGLAQAHATLGVLLLRAGRGAEGAGHLRRALELDPGAPEVHYNLALLALRGGDRAGALRHLRCELEANPDHPAARALLRELEQGGGGGG